MSIETLKNKVERRQKHKRNKDEYQEIGTFIKKRRKELNITQDVVSSGICSISYLSKIENNQITPNEFFIREIMTKLQVEDDFTNTFIEDQSYLKSLIKSFFFENEKHIERTYKDISTLSEGIVFHLGEFIYGIFRDSKDIHIQQAKLENLVMNMDDYELKTFLVFSSIYHVHRKEFKKALLTLQIISTIHYNDDFLDSLYHYYSYMTKQRLQMKNTSLHHYNIARDIFSKYLNIRRNNDVLLKRISYIMDEDILTAEKLLESIHLNSLESLSEDYYHILYAEVLIRLHQTKDASLKLNNINSSSPYYHLKLVLMYKICMMEKDDDLAHEIALLIKDVDHNSIDPKDRIHYYTLSQLDPIKRKEYLRDIAIPYSIKSSDLVRLEAYIIDIMNICIETSRYKEATQYHMKYIKELDKIKHLLHKKKDLSPFLVFFNDLIR